jgi:hypothetical protein
MNYNNEKEIRQHFCRRTTFFNKRNDTFTVLRPFRSCVGPVIWQLGEDSVALLFVLFMSGDLE